MAGQRKPIGRYSAEQQFPVEPRSIAASRDFVDRTLAQWGFSESSDIARLLVDELVTNAIVHAQSAAVVRLGHDDGRVLRIEVEDSDAAKEPTPAVPDESATQGRGLQLVDGLSRSWGFERTAGGKVVWCEMELTGGLHRST
jgi:anti-sigma regulatory factor (Ser/Thr protein kinase)